MAELKRLLGLGALAGLLGALGFPLVLPAFGDQVLLDAGPREVLLFVAVGILYRVVEGRASLRRRALGLLAGGVVHFAVVLFWIDIAMTTFGRMPQWQAIPALGLLVVWCALFWAAVPALFDLVRPVVRHGPLSFGVAVLLSEWLRANLLTGFPWALFGYALVRNQPVLQWASITGVWGLSLLVALVGALGAHYLAARKTPQALPRALALLAVLILPWGIGQSLLARRPPPSGEPVEVALLQASVDQLKKNKSALFRQEIVETYRGLMQRAILDGADLVIWPEAAWPGNIAERTKALPDAAAGVPTLLGVSLHARDRSAAYNSAFWLSPEGEVQGRYDKQHLVPFGEYVPARWLLPVEKVVPGLRDYHPGTRPDPVGTPPVGVLICYDGIFPEIARAEVQAGAQLLANLTNDAWYGISSAPYQHRDFYVMRAVETGRWVMRAANSGISTFIDPQGGIHEATRLGEVTALLGEVQPYAHTTFFVWAGNWVVAIAIGVGVWALGVGLARRLERAPASTPPPADSQ